MSIRRFRWRCLKRGLGEVEGNSLGQETQKTAHSYPAIRAARPPNVAADMRHPDLVCGGMGWRALLECPPKGCSHNSE